MNQNKEHYQLFKQRVKAGQVSNFEQEAREALGKSLPATLLVPVDNGEDALDRALRIGSTPNWITPLWTLIQDWMNGPSHHFYIDLYAGYSVNDVTRTLKRNGIKVWGGKVLDGYIACTVRKSQARWAQGVLDRNGIPIIGGYIL